MPLPSVVVHALDEWSPLLPPKDLCVAVACLPPVLSSSLTLNSLIHLFVVPVWSPPSQQRRKQRLDSKT